MIDKVRQEELQFRRTEEEKRQQRERVALGQAYDIEKKKFEVDWAAKVQAVEEACEEKIRVMEEVNEVRRADLERELSAKLAVMRFRASPKLLELEDQEKRLARGKEFKGAAEIGARAARLRMKEMAAFNERGKQIQQKPRTEFEAAVQAEMRNLKQKCHAMRLNVKREKAQAYAIFEQRYRNLDADLTHAHAIEYKAPAEVGPVLSNPSRSAHSSTFRGSLMLGTISGTKFDVKAV